MNIRLITLLFLFLRFSLYLPAQVNPYPDQHYYREGAADLLDQAPDVSGIIPTIDSSGVQLQDSLLSGYLILKPDTALYPFDIGLPSWNGTVPGDNASFRIFVRVPYANSWSPWLEVGYWKANLWSGSMETSFSGGWINIDTMILYNFATVYQFKVEMKRNSVELPSPTVSLLSMFLSDDRTTDNIDYNQILNDNPEPIFIPTTFLAQSEVSSEYGGRICSPTTVSMILLSYGISVDPLQFALDTYDPYWEIFGVWPRVVQNASEYGLRGMVTRYRNWSAAREVLAAGGRIAMSVGPPLYTGHLMMLAGFNAAGSPIVHDPARRYDGYAHVYNKSDISHSWFDKGGVAYTFFLRDSSAITAIRENDVVSRFPLKFRLYPCYPNPFNAATTLFYSVSEDTRLRLSVHDLSGRKVITLFDKQHPKGDYKIIWNGRDRHGAQLPSGVYLFRLEDSKGHSLSGRMTLLK